jgi:hypothetical protein
MRLGNCPAGNRPASENITYDCREVQAYYRRGYNAACPGEFGYYSGRLHGSPILARPEWLSVNVDPRRPATEYVLFRTRGKLLNRIFYAITGKERRDRDCISRVPRGLPLRMDAQITGDVYRRIPYRWCAGRREFPSRVRILSRRGIQYGTLFQCGDPDANARRARPI